MIAPVFDCRINKSPTKGVGKTARLMKGSISRSEGRKPPTERGFKGRPRPRVVKIRDAVRPLAKICQKYHALRQIQFCVEPPKIRWNCVRLPSISDANCDLCETHGQGQEWSKTTCIMKSAAHQIQPNLTSATVHSCSD